jgi:salicylate hydroxylase
LVIAKSTFIANGKTLERTYEDNYQGTTETYGAPWYFSHRVDLHAELKRLAVSNDGIGKPVDIIAGSKAVDYVCNLLPLLISTFEELGF